MLNNDIYDDFYKYANDGNKVTQNKINASVWCIHNNGYIPNSVYLLIASTFYGRRYDFQLWKIP